MTKQPKGKRAPGAGRPNKLGKTKLTAVRFPVATLAYLDEEAQRRGVTVSHLIRTMVGASIPR